MGQESQPKQWIPASFFPVSPLILVPEALGEFSVYLRQGQEFVLYSRSGERFTHTQRVKLFESGVDEVYVQTVEKPGFDEYIEENLGAILADESLPLEERSRLFYDTSAGVIRDAFDEKLPPRLEEEHFSRVRDVVRQSTDFLRDERALRTVAPFIDHDYKSYTHSLQVFVYAVSLYSSFEPDEDQLYEYGLGALLHDIGKTRIPLKVLNKRGALTKEERALVQTHSVQGVALCANLEITQRTFNSILFHHERMDGKGYPSGIKGEDIPLAVRCITVADIYDALTSNRPYAPAMRPYDALILMRDEMSQAIDLGVYKRFITMLSGAKIV
ncbi:HD domain-containing protein [Paucidesulfovibrio gracilis DSM 16080]|uniref:HD domain-containing protein n=1 Tax=Paucidesulfovibrio gracilis DSM 16080 TaxID=1121449 RepID=A0A1T4X8X7_9BACT|nr:HD domain-containing phosphohydrolase [Paucidesulfovibrio gracilis]SKA85899.1 HD domain-containing protein [Paucidesulfovibrio gracilis DSM 16080]